MLFSKVSTTSPLAFVYLSQVPYTGVGDTAAVLFYILALAAWSGAIAYTVLNWRTVVNSLCRLIGISPIAIMNEAARAHITARPEALQPHSPHETALQINDPMEKKELIPSPMSLAIHSTEEKASQDNSDWSYLKVMREAKPRALPVQTQTPASSALDTLLLAQARESLTLISPAGAELIKIAAEGNERNALQILSQLISVAKNQYPTEDGWLHLTKERVKDILFSTYMSMIPSFVEWMVEGNSRNLFGFIRMMTHQSHSGVDFMKAVVFELDSAYRARTTRGITSDPYVSAAISRLSNRELEKMIEALVTGIDVSYSNEETAIKLALAKVLDITKRVAPEPIQAPRLTGMPQPQFA